MSEVLRPDGSLVAYEVSGSGDPVLLLAPRGMSSAGSEWDRYFIDPRSLIDEFTIITIDQRYAGSGRSPLTPFSHEQAVHDQLAVVDSLGFADVAVIGADLYCATALKLACDAPARTSAAVLIEPMGVDESNKIDGYYNIFNETIRIARAEGLEAVIDAALRNPVFADNPAAGPFSQRLHDESLFRDALRSMGREGYIALIVDFRDGVFPWGKHYFSVNDHSVNGAKVPLLVVAGSNELHPPGIAAQIVSGAANARICDGGGADAILDEIHAFLRGMR